ncbi:unnamed protein product, partial [Prunus brigantina]
GEPTSKIPCLSKLIREEEKGCGFFGWVDVEFRPREKALVSWLLRRLKELKKDVGHRQARERK